MIIKQTMWEIATEKGERIAYIEKGETYYFLNVEESMFTLDELRKFAEMLNSFVDTRENMEAMGW